MAGTFLYLGAYTTETDSGLNVYRLDSTTGALEHVQAVAEVINPSFLTVGPERRFVYTISEVGEFNGLPSGGVSAMAIEGDSGKLRLLNQQSSVGRGPCHIDVDATRRCAVVANYGGGSVAMLPIASDGSLEEASDFVQHEGVSIDPKRQKGPHAHSINVDPTNTFAYAPDLGLDKVLCYRLDLGAGRLVPHDPPWVSTAPGCGPRHMAFHPSGRFAYVITEMGNTVIAYRYDAATGGLTQIQTVPTLPEDYRGSSFAADIHLSPDGRFLYGSNRGHDSIAVFAVDQTSGKLKLLNTVPSGGTFPRNFGMDARGHFLVVANQNSGNLVVYRRDGETGFLEPSGHEIQVAKPVCVRLVEL